MNIVCNLRGYHTPKGNNVIKRYNYVSFFIKINASISMIKIFDINEITIWSIEIIPEKCVVLISWNFHLFLLSSN